MNNKLSFIFKEKKNYKIILYLLIFTIVIFSTYFLIPKFYNYPHKLIKESLKKNNNLHITKISNLNYQIFPSPRIKLFGVNLRLEKNILETENAEIDIILNLTSIINYKKINYKNILVKNGTTKIKTSETNQLLNYINRNEKKISFQENTIILLKDNKKLFKVDNSEMNINIASRNQQLSINGFLLNHKVSFLVKKNAIDNTNIIFKIPELDISTNISIKKENNFKTFEGLVNLSVLNNFLQFNINKEKTINLKKGFLRNDFVNFSFEGEMSFKPHFFFDLNIEPSSVNVKKLISIIKQSFFSKETQELEIIKKLNGLINFKNTYEGKVIFENKKIYFQNFRTNKNSPIFFNGKISEFGKKGRIQFDLLKNTQNNVDSNKELKISGFINPFSSKVNFEKMLFNEEIFTNEKIKVYEEKFTNDVINNSLDNLFNESKINNFLKDIEN